MECEKSQTDKFATRATFYSLFLSFYFVSLYCFIGVCARIKEWRKNQTQDGNREEIVNTRAFVCLYTWILERVISIPFGVFLLLSSSLQYLNGRLISPTFLQIVRSRSPCRTITDANIQDFLCGAPTNVYVYEYYFARTILRRLWIIQQCFSFSLFSCFPSFLLLLANFLAINISCVCIALLKCKHPTYIRVYMR